MSLKSVHDKFIAALPAEARENVGIITALLPLLLNMCGGNVRSMLMAADKSQAKVGLAANGFLLAERIHNVTGRDIDADRLRQILNAGMAVIDDLTPEEVDAIAGSADVVGGGWSQA